MEIQKCVDDGAKEMPKRGESRGMQAGSRPRRSRCSLPQKGRNVRVSLKAGKEVFPRIIYMLHGGDVRHSRHDLFGMIRKVWLPVWAGLSLMLLIPSVMALLISPGGMNSIAAAVAVPHQECPLCGMTRGYAEMANGHVREAWEWNKGAPFWFSIGLLNGGAAVIYVLWGVDEEAQRKCMVPGLRER